MIQTLFSCKNPSREEARDPLWKEAEPDIPIVKQARPEYAKENASIKLASRDALQSPFVQFAQSLAKSVILSGPRSELTLLLLP
jgi:hypothetical protein